MRKKTKSIGFIRWCCVFLFAILIVSTMGPKAYAQEQKLWSGNINVFVGTKLLDADDWEPVEDQFTLGVGLDFRPPNWPVSLALDWSYSWDEGEESVIVFDPWLGPLTFNVDLEGKTMEIDPGIRYIYEKLPYVRPFIGAGLAVIWAEARAMFMRNGYTWTEAALKLKANIPEEEWIK